MIETKKEIFQKLEFNLKRIIKIIENLKSIKQSLIIHKIYTNLNNLIPSGTVFSEKNDIKKFLSIYIHFRENYLITEANLIGQDLLNILMYIHAIVQSPYAKKALHYFVNNYNINKFKKKEINKVSKLNSIIQNLDYYLISSLEFLLKKCQNITTLRDITNPREIAGRVIDFIKIYWSYLIECNNMLLLDSPELKEMKIHFNENLDFFFEIEYKSNIFYDRGQKLFEIHNTPEFDDKNDQVNYYNALKEDFGYLDEFWYEKFGYRISKLIDVIEEFSILPITMLKRYYAPFDKMTPVINVSNLKGKSINTIKKMFENYLYKIILPYFKKPIFRGTMFVLPLK